MKFIILTLLLSLSVKQISAVVFEGPCPFFPDRPNFSKWDVMSCDKIFGEQFYSIQSFRVYAHLPVDDHTWNLFHCPFDHVGCVEVELFCPRGQLTTITMRQKCHKTTDGDDNPLLCLSTTVDYFHRGNVQQYRQTGLFIQGLCREEFSNFVTYFLPGNDSFAIIGCRNLTENSHEEGGWILVGKDKVNDLEEEVLDGLVDIALNEMPPLSATRSNFNIVEFEEEYTCECKDCEYMLLCPSNRRREASGFDYYDGYDYYGDDFDYYYDDEDDGHDDHVDYQSEESMDFFLSTTVDFGEATTQDGTEGTTGVESTESLIDVDGTEVTTGVGGSEEPITDHSTNEPTAVYSTETTTVDGTEETTQVTEGLEITALTISLEQTSTANSGIESESTVFEATSDYISTALITSTEGTLVEDTTPGGGSTDGTTTDETSTDSTGDNDFTQTQSEPETTSTSQDQLPTVLESSTPTTLDTTLQSDTDSTEINSGPSLTTQDSTTNREDTSLKVDSTTLLDS